MSFGNKGMLSSAVGVHDVKSIVLEVLFLSQCANISNRKKVFSITGLVLNVTLCFMVLAVFLIKKDERFRNLSRMFNRAIIIISSIIAYFEIMQIVNF